MCSAPQPPAPPDPRETSAASTSTNVGTAISNAFLGNVNQVTPEGSLNYDQTGSYTWNDPYTGQSYQIPRFTATQTLSPEGETLRSTQAGTKQNIANIGRDQSARIGALLGTPLDLSNQSVEGRLYDLAMNRLAPQLGERRSSYENDLINRGIRPGTDAYDRAHTVLNEGENDLYNQLFLTGRGQGVQEMLTERNQPINEITALMSGSQVSQPNYVGTNMPTIPTTDVAGLINQNYAQQFAGYSAQEAARQQMLGGLFGLGAAGIKAVSDVRLKQDIREIGRTFDGQPLYLFRYRGQPELHVGLMAHEVEKVRPEAVAMHPSGFKMVDYELALAGSGR